MNKINSIQSSFIIFCLKIYGPFLWMGFTCLKARATSRSSLLFTTKFPEISGTHFTNIERMKGWVGLGVTRFFLTRDPWIRNPAPWPLGHCSIKVYKVTVTKQLKFLYLITIYEKYCDSKKVFCDIKKLHVCLLFLLLSWKRSSFLSYKNQKNVGLFITSSQLSIMAPV